MSDGLTVHVRVNDAATGQPTPVRIRFEAQGRSFECYLNAKRRQRYRLSGVYKSNVKLSCGVALHSTAL